MSAPGLTDADVTRILQLIDNLHDVEVRIEVAGMKLHVRKLSAATAESAPRSDLPTSLGGSEAGPVERPVQQSSTEFVTTPSAGGPTKSQPTAHAVPPDTIPIRAPMLGRFFRAASPTESPYVDVGSTVEPEDTVCIIEVMKLFNTVKAGVRGTVVKIEVENGDMVEHDSVLFLVKP